MHTIEPFENWRNIYIASEDERSPFYGEDHSEFEFTNQIYNHLIHPQWDNIGSSTLFAKVLYVHYEQKFAIIELLGEWNDTLYNDIMHFKRNLIEDMMSEGINRFMLIGENVLIFHSSDDCYYQEWFEEVEDGWIAMVNFRSHVLDEMRSANIDQYLLTDSSLESLNWRALSPSTICPFMDGILRRRLTF